MRYTFGRMAKDFIARLRSREEGAFTELYERYTARLYDYILYRVKGNPAATEDILAEVFCDAIDHAPSLTDGHHLLAWLYRIAHSRIVDYIRRSVRDIKLAEKAGKEAMIAAPAEDPATMTDKEVEASLIRAALAEVPDEYRSMLEQKYIEEKSTRDIATATGRTEKAVESCLYRAKGFFRDALARMSAMPLSEEPP